MKLGRHPGLAAATSGSFSTWRIRPNDLGRCNEVDLSAPLATHSQQVAAAQIVRNFFDGDVDLVGRMMLDTPESRIRNTIETIRKTVGPETLAVRGDANPILRGAIGAADQNG